MNTLEAFSLENTRHVPEKDMELFRAMMVQTAWAEHEQEQAKKDQRPVVDLGEWIENHGAWFREEIIDNPENHHLIEEFEQKPDEVITALESLFKESEAATKH